MKSWNVVVSVGCPSGVGPEVSLQAAAKFGGTCLLVGDWGNLVEAAALLRMAKSRLVRVASPKDLPKASTRKLIHVWSPCTPLKASERVWGEPSREGGAAQLVWVHEAMHLVHVGHGKALVTGPVSKHAVTEGAKVFPARSHWRKDAAAFRGHTEYLRDTLMAREVVMAFAADELVTALVTTHLPLKSVPAAITPSAVATSAYWLAKLCDQLQRSGPIAVCGLNPHAGEQGLLGTEERKIALGIERAQKRLRKEGTDRVFIGPLGAETAYRMAYKPSPKAVPYAAVLAMYHDQATIPMKLIGFGEAVNISLGLPIVRTSVDHGTAYDAAGKGTADASGMHAAFNLAKRLTA
jgi:4-hydroxythreonine-4-phosphate dehydrogenase